MLSSLLNKGSTIIVLQIATNIKKKVLQMKIEKKEEEKNVNNDDSKSVTSLSTGSLRKTLKAFLLMIFSQKKPQSSFEIRV